MSKFGSRVHYVFIFILLIAAPHFVKSQSESQDEDEGAQVQPEEDETEKKEPPESFANLSPEELKRRNIKTLRFKAAEMTEEDQFSQHMPSGLKCDACRIIAYLAVELEGFSNFKQYGIYSCYLDHRYYFMCILCGQLTEQLHRIQKRYKTGHRLLESEVVDIIDKVCSNEKELFNAYGIKDVDGQKRFSGKGLETKDYPGVLQGGGKWPYRMQQMCDAYVDVLGEDTIYDHFLTVGSLEQLICRTQMPDQGIACDPLQEKKKHTSKKKEKSSAKKPKEEL